MSHTTPRYEYGSPEWLAAFHATMATMVAIAAMDDPTLTFSMSEISRDPPAHLGGPGAEVGWTCVVENGAMTRFTFDGSGAADYRVFTDYDAMLQMAAYEFQGSPERKAEYDAMIRGFAEAGRVRAEGRMPRLPKSFARFHDVVARFTA